MLNLKTTIAATACLAGLLPLGNAADQVLFDFDRNFNFDKVVATDAIVSEAKSEAGLALRIATGHRELWPGVTLAAPGGRWDLSAFGQLVLRVKNGGASQLTVICRVDNPGADGAQHCVLGSVKLDPGRQDTLRVDLVPTLRSLLGGKLFGMRGYPVAAGQRGGIDPRQVNQLLIYVSQPATNHLFEVDDIRASGTPAPAWLAAADSFFPFLDTFGQYKHKEWPGKTHSVEELQQRRVQEARDLADHPGPAGWCQFGGWAAGPQLEGTGFFRTEKHAGKWWLVDPDGHLFFSHGIDCVHNLADTTPVEERESWFEDFPGAQPALQAFVSHSYTLKGHYADRQPKCFSFAGANLVRKYGPQWRDAYGEVIHRRLRNWGLNTIGAWSDEGFRLLRRTPYTETTESGPAKPIEGSEGYWGKFPDVFDPGFAAQVRRDLARKVGTSAGDPWCLGYFSDNEMAWGDEVSLALAALKSPADQAAKRVFVADLRARHGDILRLNQAWGTAHASWGAFLASRATPDTKKAWADLTAFYTKTAETYFRTVRDAIKAVAPHQLYLGCRFAWANDRAARAAAPYCDVVSYNLYQRGVADFRYPGGDKPLIIGEFHFGALDRGLFHTGLGPVQNQAARAEAYQNYLKGALTHPQLVGTHWFQWKDQPTTGRVYDEENYQIGFVDIADTPYDETIAASRAVAQGMYQTRLSP